MEVSLVCIIDSYAEETVEVTEKIEIAEASADTEAAPAEVTLVEEVAATGEDTIDEEITEAEAAKKSTDDSKEADAVTEASK